MSDLALSDWRVSYVRGLFRDGYGYEDATLRLLRQMPTASAALREDTSRQVKRIWREHHRLPVPEVAA